MHTALARIAGEGPVRFDRFQADALYGPDGFYADGGVAGRGGDFVTAVETGRDFAESVALELDAAWNAAEEPAVFVVVEGGAGVGTLCSDVYAVRPACSDALRWVMVERSDVQREAAINRLAHETFPDAGQLPVAAVRDIGEMQLGEPVSIVLANELLDNLPVRVVRKGEAWEELFVGLDDGSATAVWNELDSTASRRAERYGSLVAPSAPFPLIDHAVQWVVKARRLLRPGGRVILFDYGATTLELSQRGLDGWLRTYSKQQRGLGVLENIGGQDITADVAFDQLPGGPRLESQQDWLTARGILERRAKAAALIDRNMSEASSLAAISRVQGIDALIEPDGLGGFVAATWS